MMDRFDWGFLGGDPPPVVVPPSRATIGHAPTRDRPPEAWVGQAAVSAQVLYLPRVLAAASPRSTAEPGAGWFAKALPIELVSIEWMPRGLFVATPTQKADARLAWFTRFADATENAVYPTPAAGQLPSFLLDQTAVIQSRGNSVDTDGAPLLDATTVHDSARCRLTELSMSELWRQQRDGRRASHWIDFDGDWSAIVPRDGLIAIGSRTFSIVGVVPVRGPGYVAYTACLAEEITG